MLNVLIVGGGFSGSMVAAHLLRNSKRPMKIATIERRDDFSQGAAYSTPFDCHLLNVPVHNMSAFPDDPDHLCRWLEGRTINILGEQVSGVGAKDRFIPRKLYGVYLKDILSEAISDAPNDIQFSQYHDDAAHITRQTDGSYLITLKSGEQLSAQNIVLAHGNAKPSNPWVEDRSFYDTPSYIADPWARGTLDKIAPEDPVLIIGSGLTMIDIALTLNLKDHKGKIHTVSRHGLLSHPHQAAHGKQPPYLTEDTLPKSLLAGFEMFKKALKGAQDWRSVIDSQRPFNHILWRNLSLKDKQRFLRHLRTYWDVHRHRVAPDVWNVIEEMRKRGQLSVSAARILGYQSDAGGVDVSLRARHKTEPHTLRVKHVINCTGPGHNIKRSDDPLLQSLLIEGLIAHHETGLGCAVTQDGALLDQNGTPSAGLYTLGSPKIGELWESIAIPELRGQAAELARTLLE